MDTVTSHRTRKHDVLRCFLCDKLQFEFFLLCQQVSRETKTQYEEVIFSSFIIDKIFIRSKMSFSLSY